MVDILPKQYYIKMDLNDSTEVEKTVLYHENQNFKCSLGSSPCQNQTKKDFIINFSTLLFLQAVKFRELYIACNTEGAEIFADIVFKIKEKNGSIKIMLLFFDVQQDDEVNFEVLNSQKFIDLCACYKHISQVRKNYEIFKSLKDLGSFENFEFAIFTNASIKNTNILKSCDVSLSTTLHTAKSNNTIYTITDNAFEESVRGLQEVQRYKEVLEELKGCSKSKKIKQIEEFLEGVELKEIKERLQTFINQPEEETLSELYGEVEHVPNISSDCEILKKLKIFSNHMNIEELNKLIKEEILLNNNVCDFGLQYAFKNIVQEIKISIYNSSCLKTESETHQKITEILENCTKMQTSYMEKISKEDVKFTTSSVKNVSSYVWKFRVLNVVSKTSDISMSCLKVLQALKQLANSKYLWISFNTLLDWTADVLQMWYTDPFQILVIECRTCSEDFKNVVDEIAQILRMNALKYIIVISTENVKFTSYLKNVVFPDDYYEIKDHFVFYDLNDESQETVLNCRVLFQGQLIPFGSILGPSDDLKKCLNASMVSQILLEKGSLPIGPPLIDTISNYFPRSLEMTFQIDQKILKIDTKTEIFIVSGVTLSELQNILLSQDFQQYSPENQEINYNNHLFYSTCSYLKDRFFEFCEHFPNKNVHHFLCKSGFLFWRQSKGQKQYLKEFISNCENTKHAWNIMESNKSSIYKSENLLDPIQHCTVIIGESGMGKSCLIQMLQRRTKAEVPLHWLIHLNFNNSIKLIVNTKKEDFDYDILIQTMCSLLEIEHNTSELEHILLKYEFQKRGNIVIICEGIENINSIHLNKVLDFIHALDAMKVKKIWITCTSNLKSILEKSFNTVVIEIQPLSSSDQVSFFLSVWEEISLDVHQTEIKDFLLNIQRVFSHNKKSLLTFPLYCWMAAEIFKEDLIKYLSSASVNWPDEISIIQMYDSFLSQKRANVNKLNIVHNNMINEIHEEQESFFTNKHMLCALFYILDVTEVQQLNIIDKLENVSKFVDDVKKYGIIINIVNKKPIFVHKTFAEYFSALWFSKNIKKSKELLKQKISVSNFKSILKFFDSFLTRSYELHIAVLNNDIQSLKNLLECGVETNITDKGGRTALHLAIIHSKPRASVCPAKDSEIDLYDSCTKLLVEHCTNTKIVDNVLFWKPIQYAIELEKWDALDLLLKDQIDFNEIDFFKEKLKNEKFVQEGLRIGSENGYYNLIDCFFCCGVDVRDNVIETKEGLWSPLHIAAKYGRLKLVRYLLSKRAKICIKDSKGISPLHLAACEGMIDVTVYLLQRGAELNGTDKDGNTALNFAILRNNLHMVILLIEQFGSRINHKNKFGDTPLHLAVRVGHSTIIEYLLIKGAEIELCNQEGNTALHLAVWLGILPAINVLIEYGANINVCNKFGDTPLSRNAGGGNLDIVKILVRNGAEVNKKGDDGNTALHWAARQNNLQVVEYLISEGANINAQNKFGNTALHRAVEQGCLTTTKFLINASCNIKIQNNAGLTAIKMRSRSKEVTDSIACF